MIMMMLVLRMGGLGSEIDESEKHESDDLHELSLIDIFHYAFSYMGLLAGPYVRWVVPRQKLSLSVTMTMPRSAGNIG